MTEEGHLVKEAFKQRCVEEKAYGSVGMSASGLGSVADSGTIEEAASVDSELMWKVLNQQRQPGFAVCSRVG